MFILVLIALLSINSQMYGAFIEQCLVRAAAKQGIRVEFGNPDVVGLSFRASRLNMAFVRLLLSIQLGDLSMRPSLSSVLPPSAGVAITSSAYSGTINGKISFDLIQPQRRIDLSVENLMLGQHLQLQGLGLQGGITTLKLNAILSDTAIDGRANFEIKGLNKPEVTLVPLPGSGTALLQSITVPPITNINFNVEIACQAGECEASPVVLKSSLISAEGRGRFKLPGQQAIPNLDISMQVNLSASGQEQLGPFLPLLSRGKLEARTDSFKVTIQGAASAPAVEYERL